MRKNSALKEYINNYIYHYYDIDTAAGGVDVIADNIVDGISVDLYQEITSDSDRDRLVKAVYDVLKDHGIK